MHLWRYSALGQTYTHSIALNRVLCCHLVQRSSPTRTQRHWGGVAWPHPLFITSLLSPWAFEWGDARPPFDLSKTVGQSADHMR